MRIAVILRQVPDLVEPLVLSSSGTSLDYSEARFILNESDDHALEQANLLKEACGARVSVVALDWGDIDTTLYTAAARGADQIIKIPYSEEEPPTPSEAARMFAEVIRPMDADLIMTGTQAPNELSGCLAPVLALELGLPYVGVIQRVEVCQPQGTLRVFKEYPRAATLELKVKLPAVLGILRAAQPPRYVPISRIRSLMKTTQFEEKPVAPPGLEAAIQIHSLRPPEVAERATMIEGTLEEISDHLVSILTERGLIK